MLRRLRGHREADSGFTLIELLIVVVILGILAAIVIFAVGGFTSTSAQGGCKTEIKTIETADSAYYAQNGKWPTTLASLTPKYLDSAPPTDQTSGASNHYFISWTAGSPPTVAGTFDDGAATWGGTC